MEISLKKDEHYSFPNGTNLIINEKGMAVIFNAIFTDKSFKQKLFTREFAGTMWKIL